MAHRYNSGLEILNPQTDMNHNFMFLRSGIIVDMPTNEHLIKYDAKLTKYSGKNYIYADERGELYSSPVQRLDSLIKICYFDDYLRLISEELLDPNTEIFNAAMDGIQAAVDELISSITVDIDSRIERIIGDRFDGLENVDERVRLHSELFHHSRTEVIKMMYDTGDNLTDIKTFNNDEEDILLAHTEFIFIDEELSQIIRKVYNKDNVELYMHLVKTFNFDNNGNFLSITNEKIV